MWENEQKTPHRKDKPETKESDYSWGSGRWGTGRGRRSEEGKTLLSIPFHVTSGFLEPQ